ncbi:hypothetical protein OSB04_006919, partial [Centaurea solstitialis]
MEPETLAKAMRIAMKMDENKSRDHRAKGICFQCEGKYTPGHRCPSKTLQVLLVDEEGSDGEEGEDPGHAYLDLVEVSLNSISGLTPPQTMKIKGDIRGTLVLVLIDCGSMHNFISKQVVVCLGLTIANTGVARIRLGNGLFDEGSGTCKGVVLNLPEFQVMEDFYMLQLAEDTTTSPPKLRDEFQAVVDTYRDVFEMSISLPPVRSHDHAITLQEGTVPISVRQYRYPL